MPWRPAIESAPVKPDSVEVCKMPEIDAELEPDHECDESAQGPVRTAEVRVAVDSLSVLNGKKVLS
jgi:hypothetical protein